MKDKQITDLVFFNIGYQFPLQKSLTLDFNVGGGMLFYKFTEKITDIMTDKDTEFNFYNSATIKIGYAF